MSIRQPEVFGSEKDAHRGLNLGAALCKCCIQGDGLVNDNDFVYGPCEEASVYQCHCLHSTVCSFVLQVN